MTIKQITLLEAMAEKEQKNMTSTISNSFITFSCPLFSPQQLHDQMIIQNRQQSLFAIKTHGWFDF